MNVILMIIAVLVILYFLFIFPTKWLKIERIQHPLQLNLKILQISDLHVERLRIKPERIAELIQAEKPDLVCITGDFTKRRKQLPKVEAYLKAISGCGIPVYCVLGNHDYQQKNVDELISLLRTYGMVVLRNESLHFADYDLIGIDDFDTGKSDIELAYQDVDSDKIKIVLTHDPNIVLHLHRKYDYLLSGHLHGKQFNLPYFFYMKQAGRLPKMGIYKGLHKTNYGTYYISKGIGQTGINARLFVRSEITVHQL